MKNIKTDSMFRREVNDAETMLSCASSATRDGSFEEAHEYLSEAVKSIQAAMYELDRETYACGRGAA